MTTGDFSLPVHYPLLKCHTRGWDEQGSMKFCDVKSRGVFEPHIHMNGGKVLSLAVPKRREVVTAYRVFNVTLPKGELYAVTALVARAGGISKLYKIHSQPGQIYHYPGPVCMNINLPQWAGHGDGFYSYTKPEYAVRDKPIFPVIGKVSLLGRVIEHKIGYRSQGVRIEELWVTGKNWSRVADGNWVANSGNISDDTIFFIDPLSVVADQLSQRYDCDCGILIDTKDWEDIK